MVIVFQNYASVFPNALRGDKDDLAKIQCNVQQKYNSYVFLNGKLYYNNVR